MSPTMDPIGLSDVITSQFDLEAKLNGVNDPLVRQQLIEAHIARYDGKLSYVVPEFDADSEWLNTTRPLTLSSDLSSKVVVLDFFTYCCINCMHIIPDLEALEKEFPVERGVVVVGVHSAKFDNEKELENVASAVLRYGIRHPVINDPSGNLWSTLDISCWPTLLILGPRGQVLFVLMGEGHREQLLSYVRTCVDYYSSRSLIDAATLPIRPLTSSSSSSRPLLFPGKLSWRCDHDSASGASVRRLAVADTGHHRILITSEDGIVQETIGGTESGFLDGNFGECRFRSPQGIAWKSAHVLFIADTENHAIREVDLIGQRVTTVVGTGQRGSDLEGGKFMREQVISSPWDVWFWQDAEEKNQILLIAMAGSHQIWAYAVDDDVTLLNGGRLKKGTCQRLVGSGREENRNNRYPHMASFAQPSGLCVGLVPGDDGRRRELLFVADSESSTIRDVDLKTLAVRALVGGGRDPTDLFIFGDVDGVWLEAKLQHPLGLAWCQSRNELFVADSYNHKIKRIDVNSRQCRTYCGANAADLFNEPGGICVCDDDHRLLVADTNNHRIQEINLRDDSVVEFPIRIIGDLVSSTAAVTMNGVVRSDDKRKASVRSRVDRVTVLDPISLAADGRLQILLTVTFGSGLKLNPEAPNKWNLHLKNFDESLFKLATGNLIQETSSSDKGTLTLAVGPVPDEPGCSLVLDGAVYLCDDHGRCYIQSVRFQGPITGRSSQPDARLSIVHALKLN